MLRVSPQLRDLHIKICWTQHLVATLRGVHLPEHLRFTLRGGQEIKGDLSNESRVDIMFNFFARHNGLESLVLRGTRLKHLKIWGYNDTSDILPIDFGKQLHHLNTTLDAGDVTVYSMFPQTAMRVLPKLQFLHLPSNVDLDENDMDKFVDQLPIFAKLRYLDMSGKMERSNIPEEIPKKATTILPLLEGLRLVIGEERERTIIIQRVPDGDMYRYTEVVTWNGVDVDMTAVSSNMPDHSDDFYISQSKLDVT
ncbi:hypothetical protein BU17DRAFT_66107 [Hysterangium stoloniferum]|nr:hypothetical protein BU17DRAFT_66107 [Hysterangium stoloniferum]